MPRRLRRHFAQPVPTPLLGHVPQPRERRRPSSPSAHPLTHPRHPARVFLGESEPPVEATGRFVGGLGLEEDRGDAPPFDDAEQGLHEVCADPAPRGRGVDLVEQGVLATRLDAPSPRDDGVPLPRRALGEPDDAEAVMVQERAECAASNGLGEDVAICGAEALMELDESVEVVGAGTTDGTHAGSVDPLVSPTCQYRPVPERTIVYTDGACLGNPGRGGWAWIVPDGPYGSG